MKFLEFKKAAHNLQVIYKPGKQFGLIQQEGVVGDPSLCAALILYPTNHEEPIRWQDSVSECLRKRSGHCQ